MSRLLQSVHCSNERKCSKSPLAPTDFDTQGLIYCWYSGLFTHSYAAQVMILTGISMLPPFNHIQQKFPFNTIPFHICILPSSSYGNHINRTSKCVSIHTHTRLTALCPGVSGRGISWAICKPAPCSRQVTTPAPHHSSFLQAGCPTCHPTNSIKALKAVYQYNTCTHNVHSQQ